MKVKELAEFNALYPEQYPWDTIDNNTLSRATAREFLQGYNGDFDHNLATLDRYLHGTATVKYSEFPDADLPEEFLTATNEPAEFEEFMNS